MKQPLNQVHISCKAGVEESCTRETDITLSSSDGVHFGAHSHDLAYFSDGFPPVGSVILTDEVVHLAEPSSVVLTLLKFMHRQRWPNTDTIPFDLLQKLAEAAEKYLIFSLMEVCRIQMQAAALQHPLEVFTYATKHDYGDIRDKAAPVTLDLPLESTLKHLSQYPSVRASWILFREKYVKASVRLYNQPPSFAHKCYYWMIFWRRCVSGSLIKKPLSAALFAQTWRDEYRYCLRYCPKCQGMLPQYLVWICSELKDMPPYRKLI